jgi:hypothetical protein
MKTMTESCPWDVARKDLYVGQKPALRNLGLARHLTAANLLQENFWPSSIGRREHAALRPDPQQATHQGLPTIWGFHTRKRIRSGSPPGPCPKRLVSPKAFLDSFPVADDSSRISNPVN